MTDCDGCIYNNIFYCGYTHGPLLLSELVFCPHREQEEDE